MCPFLYSESITDNKGTWRREINTLNRSCRAFLPLFPQVSFYANIQGKLSVILGSSGAGKSTLLSVLSGRSIFPPAFCSVPISGDIAYNGKVVVNSEISSLTSFVQQEDSHLLPSLTALETLEFAAELRLPDYVKIMEKKKRAYNVLVQLGLKECADTIVGSEAVKGLSGGEKRRLSIGVQLLTDPSILIIDGILTF
jgi:ABC-type multidrug transport system ATPase subunit